MDESYFGARRVRGKRGRGAGHKTIVFGIFKRNGHVYTEIIPDARKATPQAVIRGKVTSESVIHSDGWRGYDGLVDLGYDKHYRINKEEEGGGRPVLQRTLAHKRHRGILGYGEEAAGQTQGHKERATLAAPKRV